jgi:hypothetical protein
VFVFVPFISYILSRLNYWLLSQLLLGILTQVM